MHTLLDLKFMIDLVTCILIHVLGVFKGVPVDMRGAETGDLELMWIWQPLFSGLGNTIVISKPPYDTFWSLWLVQLLSHARTTPPGASRDLHNYFLNPAPYKNMGLNPFLPHDAIIMLFPRKRTEMGINCHFAPNQVHGSNQWIVWDVCTMFQHMKLSSHCTVEVI
jgi:hypothetical protein